MRRLTLAVLLLLAQTVSASAEKRAGSFLSEVERLAGGALRVSESAGVTVEGIGIGHWLVQSASGAEREAKTTLAVGNRFKAATDGRLETGDIFGIAVIWQKGIMAEEKKTP